MEYRQIRISLQIYLCSLAFIICSLTGDWEVLLIGLITANGLAYAFAPITNFISSVISLLIYGSSGQDDSYEGRFYQTDMDQARKMVREERWEEAIIFYRKIVKNIPDQVDARFELAKVYQNAGYIGLALFEFQTIKGLKDKVGDHHPFVLESERRMKELKERLCRNSVHGSRSLS